MKKNDRVKVINEKCARFEHIGTITGFADEENRITEKSRIDVEFDDGSMTQFFWMDELEIVQS